MGGGAEEFPASFFPQLCEGLIKYGWCLEQSRGMWDSTNSTSSLGRPILLRRNPPVFYLPRVFPSNNWLRSVLPLFPDIASCQDHLSSGLDMCRLMASMSQLIL